MKSIVLRKGMDCLVDQGTLTNPCLHPCLRASLRCPAYASRAEYHYGTRPAAPPQPRRGLCPPLAAQGRRAGRPASQRQEGILSSELLR
jgi:hypothetical protein